MKFKLNNAKELEKSVKLFSNPLLKNAAMQVIEGEMGGWAQFQQFNRFGRGLVHIPEPIEPVDFPDKN